MAGTPARTCVGCRRTRPKAEMLRLVRRPDGTVSVDAAGRAAGRGAYVCRERSCADRALKRLAKALRAEGVDTGRILEDLSNAGVR